MKSRLPGWSVRLPWGLGGGAGVPVRGAGLEGEACGLGGDRPPVLGRLRACVQQDGAGLWSSEGGGCGEDQDRLRAVPTDAWWAGQLCPNVLLSWEWKPRNSPKPAHHRRGGWSAGA